MGATKTEIFNQAEIDFANMAKVFAHPARVAILKYISKQTSCICNDIVDEIGLSQPTISQHLQVINDAGLLLGNYKGPAKCYCLNVEKFELYRKLFNQFFETTKSNCC
ncbi:MAG: metalloregulator ArsR/SmtB family transcription factor [Flavobacteriaceae bacterium]|nr:metalloregulator ArsR/SmtB family transcription factor [Flavobacteriaceae bacterium]